jgi:hypothetical protein
MTLEKVRDWHRRRSDDVRRGLAKGSLIDSDRMANAIDAHLAQPAQAVDVDALIRDVCETDPADPNHMDTVCIDVAMLRSIIEQHIPASPAVALYGCLTVQEAACVPHVHPERGVGWFFNERDVIESGLVTQGHGEANDKHERELGQLIDERDRREEIIDCLCDAVLGQGRPEWSSAYGYDDALLEVQEAMFAPSHAQPVLTQDQIHRHQIAASDCPPDSMVLLVSSLQRLLSAASPAGVPDGWRKTILRVLSALDAATGDSDPNIDADLTDDEVRDEYPEVWAMQQLSALLAAPSAPEGDGGEK